MVAATVVAATVVAATVVAVTVVAATVVMVWRRFYELWKSAKRHWRGFGVSLRCIFWAVNHCLAESVIVWMVSIIVKPN